MVKQKITVKCGKNPMSKDDMARCLGEKALENHGQCQQHDSGDSCHCSPCGISLCGISCQCSKPDIKAVAAMLGEVQQTVEQACNSNLNLKRKAVMLRSEKESLEVKLQKIGDVKQALAEHKRQESVAEQRRVDWDDNNCD